MELRSPIRLYWDVTPLPTPLPDYGKICAEVKASRVLTLHITDLGKDLSDQTERIVSSLATSPIMMMLTVSAAASGVAQNLDSIGVKKLYADISSPEDIKSLSGKLSGVSFRISTDNFISIPAIIEECLQCGVKELQLPMERLISGESPLILSPDNRKWIAEECSKMDRGDLKITANDPFIWRAVNPGVPFPDGICQAANTMLAIDSKGDVYPCPAMPLLLGNLQNITFREIVASSLKNETRKKILRRPDGCSGCRIIEDCRGGCRGRGYYDHNLDIVDPGCGTIVNGRFEA